MVVVVPGRLFYITTWLPLLRTSTKPCFAKMAHTSRPDRTRSLPNGYLDLCHKHIAMQSYCCIKMAFRPAISPVSVNEPVPFQWSVTPNR